MFNYLKETMMLHEFKTYPLKMALIYFYHNVLFNLSLPSLKGHQGNQYKYLYTNIIGCNCTKPFPNT